MSLFQRMGMLETSSIPGVRMGVMLSFRCSFMKNVKASSGDLCLLVSMAFCVRIVEIERQAF